MSAVQKEKSSRRPKARHRDVVMACIEERLNMIALTDEQESHRTRLFELMDELRRSNSKEGNDVE